MNIEQEKLIAEFMDMLDHSYTYKTSNERVNIERKLIDIAERQVKKLNIPDVSKRSEQLIAFFDWLNKQGNITNMYTDKYMYIEMYLKSN